MKVVWNTCDKERGGEIKSPKKNYLKSSLENFQKSLPYWEIYVKYLEKNNRQIYIIAMLLSFLYHVPVKSKDCEKPSIYLQTFDEWIKKDVNISRFSVHLFT